MWFAAVLIAVGGLWLLDAANVLSAGPTIDHWWPVAVIALGLVTAAADRRLSPGPVALMVIGALLLVGQLELVQVNAVIWPAVAILAGLWLLLNRGRRSRAREEVNERQDVVAVLGAAETRNRSPHFRHANVSAVFGGATLDMRDAQLDPGATVDALALFGGVDVIVPPGWRVELGGLPIFGGYDDKTAGSVVPPDAPVLKVAATAIFGGVDVKNKRE
jgi:hypothetical protein